MKYYGSRSVEIKKITQKESYVDIIMDDVDYGDDIMAIISNWKLIRRSGKKCNLVHRVEYHKTKGPTHRFFYNVAKDKEI